MKKTSIIMLTYNRQGYVGRAIESVLCQTCTDFEFIIVDNGSTDNSGKICDEYEKQDARIKVLHIEKSSIGAGRNAGLDAAMGDYVTFIDDDDVCGPDLLEYLSELLDICNADIAICGSWIEIDGKREPKYVFDGTYNYDGCTAVKEMLKREKFNSANPTKLFSRSLFDSMRYHTAGKYDDAAFMYRIISEAKKVTVSGEPHYTFVRHGGNNSFGTNWRESVNDDQIRAYIPLVRERTLWLSERFPDNEAFWHYAELSYLLSMYDRTGDAFLKEQLLIGFKPYYEEFLASEEFHTDRDRELVGVYRNIIEGI